MSAKSMQTALLDVSGQGETESGLGLGLGVRRLLYRCDSGRNVTPEDLRVGDDPAMFGSWFVLLPFLASPITVRR